MKIVSETPEAEIAAQRQDEARKQAQERVAQALKVLAANIMRVVRGAGRPHELADNAIGFLDAVASYQEVAKIGPFAEDIAAALNVQTDYASTLSISRESAEQIRAEEAIIRGSLQIAASRLLAQRTQESAGDDELYRGVIQLEKLRAENRKASKATSKPKAPRPKPKRPSGRGGKGPAA